jgi:hypothetical protein
MRHTRQSGPASRLRPAPQAAESEKPAPLPLPPKPVSGPWRNRTACHARYRHAIRVLPGLLGKVQQTAYQVYNRITGAEPPGEPRADRRARIIAKVCGPRRICGPTTPAVDAARNRVLNCSRRQDRFAVWTLRRQSRNPLQMEDAATPSAVEFRVRGAVLSWATLRCFRFARRGSKTRSCPPFAARWYSPARCDMITIVGVFRSGQATASAWK